MDNHSLRDGCEMPPAPSNSPEDAKHALWPMYCRYKAAMAAQLVQCLSFTNWLNQNEENHHGN